MPDLPFDTILHIGAGTGAAVQDWLDAGARHIVLVEPNPAHAAGLARLAAANPQVQVIEAAIADYDGEGLLRVFNLARHSSLADPAGLADLLPGLRQTALVPVATLTPASLLTRLPPDPGNLWLILDAPGSEMPILRGFQAVGALHQLAALDLICTEEAQYAGAVGRPQLQSLLEDTGFTVTATDLSDPDWPHLTFRADLQTRQIAALTAELRAARAEIDDLQAAMSETDSGSAATQQETAILRNALEAAQSERFSAARQIEGLERLLADEQMARSVDAAALHRQMDEARDLSDAQIRTLDAALAERDAALAAALADVATLHLLRDAQTEGRPDQDQTITRQNDRIRQLEHRQSLARDELRRSEGQLDLIKDLLLRGDRL